MFGTVNNILVEKLASVEASTNPLMKSSDKTTKESNECETATERTVFSHRNIVTASKKEIIKLLVKMKNAFR